VTKSLHSFISDYIAITDRIVLVYAMLVILSKCGGNGVTYEVVRFSSSILIKFIGRFEKPMSCLVSIASLVGEGV
jgi:hypothetical protein